MRTVSKLTFWIWRLMSSQDMKTPRWRMFLFLHPIHWWTASRDCGQYPGKTENVLWCVPQRSGQLLKQESHNCFISFQLPVQNSHWKVKQWVQVRNNVRGSDKLTTRATWNIWSSHMHWWASCLTCALIYNGGPTSLCHGRDSGRAKSRTTVIKIMICKNDKNNTG